MPEPSKEAVDANDIGAELADARRYAEAIPHYEHALRSAPEWYALHLNLGIACKHTGDWARSLESSLRAYELDPERAGSGTLWNAGIAATALADWSRARWAWDQLGIPIPAGEGPIDLNIGTTPIRVAIDDTPEVVWCHRIDPARAWIESVPTAESGRRYRDLLLHDGEPRGKRWNGHELLSVFDELTLLERSPFLTYGVDVRAPQKGDLEELFRTVAQQSDSALEDWTASLEIICKQCSEGVPHAHREEPEPPWVPERHLGVATTDDAVFGLIASWAKASGGRDASSATLLMPRVP